MRAAVVFANQSVPDCFSWSRHSHRKRQQRKLCCARRKLRKYKLIAADPRKIVYVTGSRDSNGGMDQEAGLLLFGCLKGEFHMRAVHRIPSLKRHDTAPAETRKFGPQFSGRCAQALKIVNGWKPQTFNAASQVPAVCFV